jgi:hypothetical protein
LGLAPPRGCRALGPGQTCPRFRVSASRAIAYGASRRVGWPRLTCRRDRNRAAFAQVNAYVKTSPVVEQRYRAVLEVLEDGAPVTEVARRYGVARQTVHEWLARYAQGGAGGPVVAAGVVPASDARGGGGADRGAAAGSSGMGAVADPVGAGAGRGGALPALHRIAGLAGCSTPARRPSNAPLSGPGAGVTIHYHDRRSVWPLADVYRS